MKINMKQINSQYTEEVLEQEEAEYINSQNMIEEQKSNIFSVLNEWLLQNTVQAKKQLIYFFKDPALKDYINCVAELRYLKIVMTAFEAEINARECQMIIDGTRDMDILIEILLQIKFKIWEIEFDIVANAEAELVHFIHECRVSKIFVKSLIQTYALHPAIIWKRFEQYYEKV